MQFVADSRVILKRFVLIDYAKKNQIQKASSHAEK